MKQQLVAVDLAEEARVAEIPAQIYDEPRSFSDEAYEDVNWKGVFRELVTSRRWRVRILVAFDALVSIGSVFFGFWLYLLDILLTLRRQCMQIPFSQDF